LENLYILISENVEAITLPPAGVSGVSKKLTWGWARTQVLSVFVDETIVVFTAVVQLITTMFLEIFVMKSTGCPFYSPHLMTPPSRSLPFGASSEPPCPQNVLATGLLTKTDKLESPLNVVTRFGFLATSLIEVRRRLRLRVGKKKQQLIIMVGWPA